MENKRNSFKGSLGFILAAAGSAVGLGNIWRFPYLAAKDGGGLFLLVYLVLVVTFGFISNFLVNVLIFKIVTKIPSRLINLRSFMTTLPISPILEPST